jgi:hypothetical protein
VRFVDLNGDGLVDMVWQAYWNGPWAPQGAWLNNGNGWTSAPQYIPPAAITNEARDAGVRFEDINGDGVLDIVWHAAWAGPWNPVAAWTNSGGAPDLLASVTSGLGATTSVAYKPLTDAALYTKDPVSAFPLVSIQPALHAVSALDASDGRGGSITTSYAYGGLKAEAGTGRGELGFRWQESTQQASGLKVRTEHRQDWPYVGLPSLVKRTQGSSAVLSQTLNAYGSTHPAAGVYFPFLSQSVETSNDLNGAPLPTVTVNTSYDANGNPTSVTLSTGDGHSKTTTNIFDNDRLKRSTVQSTSP